MAAVCSALSCVDTLYLKSYEGPPPTEAALAVHKIQVTVPFRALAPSVTECYIRLPPNQFTS